MSNKELLRKYIDRIAILSNNDKVFGVKTLRIKNGFIFKGTIGGININPTQIEIAVVALFDFWHGYERLIKGLRDYYLLEGKDKFLLHFVGEGPELGLYRHLAADCNLKDYVRFYGMRSSKFLESLYGHCAFGCCGLGGFKKNMHYSSELKSREYLAAGLPIIASCEMDIENPKIKEYIIKVPNDDSPIDFFELSKYYQSFYARKKFEEIQAMRRQIREQAESELNMENGMRNVIEYVMAE